MPTRVLPKLKISKLLFSYPSLSDIHPSPPPPNSPLFFWDTSSTLAFKSAWGLTIEHFSLTWPAAMSIYWNKRKCLHKETLQLPQDLALYTNMATISLFLVHQYVRRGVIWKCSIYQERENLLTLSELILMYTSRGAKRGLVKLCWVIDTLTV